MNNKALWPVASALLIVTIAVTMSTIEAFAAQTSQIPAGSASWLHVCGTKICDAQNQPVTLLGVNFTGEDHDGLGLADLQKLKALGFNTIRVMIAWKRLQPYGEGLDGIDTQYFTGTDNFPLLHGLDEVMNWFVSENMYLILTLRAGGDSGTMPSWTFPGMTDESQRETALILNKNATRERTGIMNTWKYIANRYRDVPNLIIELVNEPQVLSNGTSYSLIGSSYKTFNEDIISSIESVETESHLKLVEPLIDLGSGDDWNWPMDGAMDVGKANVVWAYHYYFPMSGWDPNGSYYHGSFTWRGRYYGEARGNGTLYVIWRITTICDKLSAWNKPLMVTEFAKDTTQTYWKEWYKLVLQITSTTYDPSGWILHQYCSDPQYIVDNGGWNINNPTVQQEVLPIVMSYLNPQWLPVRRRS
jgi:hypothetical protein